jgi:hypothetical protein
MQLFQPIVPEERFHPNFRNLLTIANGFDLDVLTDWASGFVDRDGKFVEEFQTSFNSCFWELYLFAVLKKYGMDVDFSHASPDFVVPDPGFSIEAVVALHAQDAVPEHAHPRGEPPPDLNAFNFRAMIRLSNSLTTKHRAFQNSYSKMDHVRDRPFIVALAHFDQPYSFLASQRPIEAVLHGYYVDEERYIATSGREGRLEGQALHEVVKGNGSPVPLGIFTTPSHREISAVMFNACASKGKVRALSRDPADNSVFTAVRYNPASHKPHVIQRTKRDYSESLLDGLRVYHNPFADHPADPAWFRHPAVFQAFHDGHDWVYEQREGVLLSRQVLTLLQTKDAKTNVSTPPTA